jgi:lauroyl/myristoyl acyltransferase
MKSQLQLKTVLDYLVYLLVRIAEELINVVPERAVMAFGRFLGRLGFVILPDRQAAAIENLTIAFGNEQSKAWIRETALKSFEHLGLLAVEFFRIRRWTETDMRNRLIIEGRDPYNLLMLPGNHGICLLNSHFGCFEVSAATVKHLGFKTHLIATGLKNPFLTRYLFSRAGEDAAIYTHPHRGSVKELIELMSEGALLACLADQRGDAERGIFVDYFGTPAPANEIFAKMTIESGARVLPLCTFRLGDGRYKSIFGEEINISLTGDRKQDLINVSQLFHNQFEYWLRLHPEQGFWVQRKWRRAPSRRRKKRK